MQKLSLDAATFVKESCECKPWENNDSTENAAGHTQENRSEYHRFNAECESERPYAVRFRICFYDWKICMVNQPSSVR